MDSSSASQPAKTYKRQKKSPRKRARERIRREKEKQRERRAKRQEKREKSTLHVGNGVERFAIAEIGCLLLELLALLHFQLPGAVVWVNHVAELGALAEVGAVDPVGSLLDRARDDVRLRRWRDIVLRLLLSHPVLYTRKKVNLSQHLYYSF